MARSLRDYFTDELHQPVPHGADVLASALCRRYGDAVRAILFYGSCLRTKDDQHSLLDFYVFVDDYRSYTKPVWAFLNGLLPPNVFYLEVAEGDVTYRLKYAVVSLDDLDRLTSTRAWQPYFWARFAQSCALVYAADGEAERRVVNASVRALKTFLLAIGPLLPPSSTIRELWQTGLSHTYRTELRSEPPGRAPQIYDLAADRYEEITRLALAELPTGGNDEPTRVRVEAPVEAGASARVMLDYPQSVRSQARRFWNVRVVEGKTLFLLRILKNWCTFEGGVEYVIWKIERHSGVKADPRWKEKRFRVLAVATEAWRIWRKGGFR